MRRTNDDKRRAVRVLLEDQEWSQWSDREIARRCGVDHKTVASLRPQYVSGELPQIARKVERGGTVYTQNVTNIGGTPRPVDRPVFDNTAFGEQGPTHADVIPVPARQTRDASGDYIHHALTGRRPDLRFYQVRAQDDRRRHSRCRQMSADASLDVWTCGSVPTFPNISGRMKALWRYGIMVFWG